jgi:hypothetical protein
MRFQPGDVFVTDPNGVQEYSPTGELRQDNPQYHRSRSAPLHPVRHRLVLPGVGLFNRARHLVPSSWASAPDGRCTVDTAGNVYVLSGLAQITKYNLKGRRAQTFQVASDDGIGPYYLALAPDQCTIYYGGFDARPERLDVCTGTQESPLSLFYGCGADDLQFRPNGQAVMTDDVVAWLYEPTAGTVQDYGSGPLAFGTTSRSVSLDPDGTSFWDCCQIVGSGLGTPEIFRFDIASGQILATWASPVLFPGGMAVYDPQRIS